MLVVRSAPAPKPSPLDAWRGYARSYASLLAADAADLPQPTREMVAALQREACALEAATADHEPTAADYDQAQLLHVLAQIAHRRVLAVERRQALQVVDGGAR